MDDQGDEARNIADGLRRMVDGQAWHGPDLRSLLADVSADEAVARPVPEAHTMRELVLHAAGWQEIVRRRLAGERVAPTAEDDWPPAGELSETAWRHEVDVLLDGGRRLAAAVAELAPERLGDTLPGREDTAGLMLRGLIEHHAYHAGQIALLRKALGLGRPQREETP